MLRRSLPPPGRIPLLAVTGESAPVNRFVPGLTNRFEWLKKLKNSERNCPLHAFERELDAFVQPEVERSQSRTSTASLKPNACNKASRLERRGLPSSESIRYKLSRFRSASAATRPMPRASATSRRARRNTRLSSSPSAASKYAAASAGSCKRSSNESR